MEAGLRIVFLGLSKNGSLLSSGRREREKPLVRRPSEQKSSGKIKNLPCLSDRALGQEKKDHGNGSVFHPAAVVQDGAERTDSLRESFRRSRHCALLRLAEP